MANLKVGHNLAQESRIMREVSEGVHPRLSVVVAPYLPVKKIKYQGSEQYPVVIQAGELVALDQWNQLVPANGGTTTTNGLAYTQLDVDWGVHVFNNAAAYGVGALATVASVDLLANNCIGYAFTDYVSSVASTGADNTYLNYGIQTANKTVSTDWVIQVPIVNATQDDVAQGASIMADTLLPGKWRPVISSDFATAAQTLKTINSMVGRCLKVEKITDHLLKADVIQGAPGLGLYGTIDTAGIPNFLSTAATVTRPDNSAAGSASGKYTATILIRV